MNHRRGEMSQVAWLLMCLLGISRGCAFEPSDEGIFAIINTSEGSMVARLYYEEVPYTVANFILLAEGRLSTYESVLNGIAPRRAFDDVQLRRSETGGFFTLDPGNEESETRQTFSIPAEVRDTLPHDRAGLLSTEVTSGRSEGNKFSLTLEALPARDGVNSVFGGLVEGGTALAAAASDALITLDRIDILRNGTFAMEWDPLEFAPRVVSGVSRVSSVMTKNAELEIGFRQYPFSYYTLWQSFDLVDWSLLHSRDTRIGRVVVVPPADRQFAVVLSTASTNLERYFRLLEERYNTAAEIEEFGEATVTLWPEGRRAALSLSFDDGYRSHAEVVATRLEAHGWHGTFYLNPGWMNAGWTLSWSDAREMSAKGHEIGNHSLTHPKLGTIPLGDAETPDTAVFEVVEGHRLLLEQVYSQTGQVERSFGYPFADPGVEAIRDAVMGLHGAARGSYGSFNDPIGPFLRSLRARTVSFGDPRELEHDRQTLDSIFNEFGEVVLPSSGWQILLFHDVEETYSEISGSLSISLKLFDEFLEWGVGMENSHLVWIETVSSVARYVRARNGIVLETLRADLESIELKVVCSTASDFDGLPDPWIEVTVAPEWENGARVAQGDHSVWMPAIAQEGRMFVRFAYRPGGNDTVLLERVPTLE